MFSTALVGCGSGQWLIAAGVVPSTQPEAVYGSIRNRFMKFKPFQHCSAYFGMQTFGAWIFCAAFDAVSGWVNVFSECIWECMSMARESWESESISGWLIDRLVEYQSGSQSVTQIVSSISHSFSLSVNESATLTVSYRVCKFSFKITMR